MLGDERPCLSFGVEMKLGVALGRRDKHMVSVGRQGVGGLSESLNRHHGGSLRREGSAVYYLTTRTKQDAENLMTSFYGKYSLGTYFTSLSRAISLRAKAR